MLRLASCLLAGLLASPMAAQQAAEALATATAPAFNSVCRDARDFVYATPAGHIARTDKQQWTVRFDGLGLLIEPDVGDWTWGLQLETYGRAGAPPSIPRPGITRTEGPRLTYVWDDILDEWYVNSRGVIEHGYTLHDRPEGHGPLNLLLSVRGNLLPEVDEAGRNIAFRDGDEICLTYSGLTVVDADGVSLSARFTITAEGLLLTIQDCTARYPITIDPTAQQAYLKAAHPDGGDIFGWAVAADGDTLVVGAPFESSNAPGVNGNPLDNSMFAAGAAYVFARNGATWLQQGYLKASDPNSFRTFGWSVAISGDTIAVGSPGGGTNAAVYVFTRHNGMWSQQARLTASNADAGDSFGFSVAADGDTLLVGAPSEDSNATGVNGNGADNSASNSGAAYVFIRTGTAWTQQAYLKASNTGGGDNFGCAVALSGDLAAVGAYWEASSANTIDGNPADDTAAFAGAAYVFERSGSIWTQQAYLKASNSETLDEFGYPIAISGDTIVVGAIGEDSSASGAGGNQSDNSAASSGAAYVFTRGSGMWVQQAYLKASNTDAADEFGGSVAISGDTIVVGASREDGGSAGTDGNQGDNSSSGAGAAYVFTRNGTSWAQRAYLKASAPDPEDRFGFAVATTAEIVLIGAFQEDSGSTGVNGNAADNGSSNAGAAYVFDLRSGCLGANGRPTLSATQEPQIGQSYTLTTDGLEPVNSFAILVFGVLQLPLPGVDLGPILGMTGCDLYHSPDIFVPAPLGTSGSASWTWSPVTGLPGDNLFCQALCLDLAANPFGFTVSNQLRITLAP